MHATLRIIKANRLVGSAWAGTQLLAFSSTPRLTVPAATQIKPTSISDSGQTATTAVDMKEVPALTGEIIKSTVFKDLHTYEAVLQVLREPKAPLRTIDYVLALHRVNRLSKSNPQVSQLTQDPTFHKLLEILAGQPFDASAVGLISHAMRKLRIRHGALEDHLQARALHVSRHMSAAAIENYLNWIVQLHAPNMKALEHVLDQVAVVRADFTLQQNVFTLKAIATAMLQHPTLKGSIAIKALYEEFVKKRPDLVNFRNLMGEFCRTCADLRVFSPELVASIGLKEFCETSGNSMGVSDVIGILAAFAEAHLSLPDDLLAALLARIRVLAPVMRTHEICETMYHLGRGPFEGLPPNPLVDVQFVNFLLGAIITKSSRLSAKEIGLVMYGLAGLPKPNGLPGAIHKLASRLDVTFRNSVQEFRTVSDLTLVIEGFAGLSDVYTTSTHFGQRIHSLLLRLKSRFNTEQATRVLRALAVLPGCRSKALTELFQRLFPDASKFPSKEAFDAFQEAIAQLPKEQEVSFQEAIA